MPKLVPVEPSTRPRRAIASEEIVRRVSAVLAGVTPIKTYNLYTFAQEIQTYFAANPKAKQAFITWYEEQD